MFPVLRFRLLVLLSRTLCPQLIAPPHHGTQTGSILVPDFVDDSPVTFGGVSVPVDQDLIDNDAWMQVVNHPDTIANARGFLEEVYQK